MQMPQLRHTERVMYVEFPQSVKSTTTSAQNLLELCNVLNVVRSGQKVDDSIRYRKLDRPYGGNERWFGD